MYTSFREEDGAPQRHCILSISADRETARSVDWEEWTAEQVVDALGARYRLGERGRPLPIEVEPPAARGRGGYRRRTGENSLMSELRLLTAGESHGKALVAILEGMPAGLPITEDFIAS